MRAKRNRTADTAGAHRRSRDRAAGGDAGVWQDGGDAALQPPAPADATAGAREPDGALDGTGPVEAPVAVRTATGWRVGDEEVPDLTSAMVLADLLAADLPTQAFAAVPAPEPAGKSRSRRPSAAERPPDPEKLKQTVSQLEHALAARVRVEQAIGVLAERHRIRPRQAFDLLRSAARARGRRVMEIATEVVESATNPLLRIPEELAKPPVARRRGRMVRHTLEGG